MVRVLIIGGDPALHARLRRSLASEPHLHVVVLTGQVYERLAERVSDLELRLARCEIAAKLSEREQEVLRLVAQGLSNPRFAQALFISVATVKLHINHILHKLNLTRRAELAELGRHVGLV